ncbi:MAG: hypothetical protein IKP54_09080, partial [Bacteroidales bacterium]|nr:hypothetical protein [Bacteroidales bacterium]
IAFLHNLVTKRLQRFCPVVNQVVTAKLYLNTTPTSIVRSLLWRISDMMVDTAASLEILRA